MACTCFVTGTIIMVKDYPISVEWLNQSVTFNVCKPPFISSRSYINECSSGTSISETIVKVESFIIKVMKSSRIYRCSGIKIFLLVQDRASSNTKAITSSCRKQNDSNPSQNDAGNDHPNPVPKVNRQRERPQSWHTAPRY